MHIMASFTSFFSKLLHKTKTVVIDLITFKDRTWSIKDIENAICITERKGGSTNLYSVRNRIVNGWSSIKTEQGIPYLPPHTHSLSITENELAPLTRIFPNFRLFFVPCTFNRTSSVEALELCALLSQEATGDLVKALTQKGSKNGLPCTYKWMYE